ncbi:MAG: phosphoribosyl-AMP cyclohydrolase [Methylococcales bacterium]|nr:phosphoribosyl-AMP cyclohydrolase [Methylococcaceae bacterium]
MSQAWLDEIRWTQEGLIPVIAQQADNGKILMFAWMNRESLALTADQGYAVYWSRSRGKLWHKGEESGHRQKVFAIYLDCDEDVIVLKVEQQGGIACHTGRESCFYRQLMDGQWQVVEPVLKNPEDIYKSHE